MPRVESAAPLRPAMPGLGRAQLAWLAAAVFVVSAGYSALMPLLPEWLRPLMGNGDAAMVSRHVGYLSGMYTAGVLAGAPLWGLLSDRMGRRRVLMAGLVGYVASLVPMLRPEWLGVAGIYGLRGATGFFVAAVVPVVPALVAEHTPQSARARRFAWLGAMSLLGFLFGPGLNAATDRIARWAGRAGLAAWSPAEIVIALSARLGAPMMIGLAATLPVVDPSLADDESTSNDDASPSSPLWLLNGTVMFVLSGFELGIVLQGQQHPGLSSRDVSLMFAACSLVMLAFNALLFFTGLLERADPRKLLGTGLVLATVGLAMLARHGNEAWMYIGVSFTAAGTGLVLPTVGFPAAGASRRRLGAAMGGLAAAAGFGQTIGSAVAGWLFGLVAQMSFAWLSLPLLVTLGLVLARPDPWLRPAPRSLPPASPISTTAPPR